MQAPSSSESAHQTDQSLQPAAAQVPANIQQLPPIDQLLAQADHPSPPRQQPASEVDETFDSARNAMQLLHRLDPERCASIVRPHPEFVALQQQVAGLQMQSNLVETLQAELNEQKKTNAEYEEELKTRLSLEDSKAIQERAQEVQSQSEILVEESQRMVDHRDLEDAKNHQKCRAQEKELKEKLKDAIQARKEALEELKEERKARKEKEKESVEARKEKEKELVNETKARRKAERELMELRKDLEMDETR